MVRELRKSDHAFILASWGVIAHDDLPYRWMTRDAWRKQYKKMCRWLETSGRAILAINPDDEEHILGYVAFDDQQPLCVHFAYVKDKFRRYGLCRALMARVRMGGESEPVSVSHYPRSVAAKHLFRDAQYDPHRLWST